MNRHEERVGEYLMHMLDANARIRRYTDALSNDTFLGSDLVQDAVIRNIEIIGEAAGKIMRQCPDFAAAHPEVPWRNTYLMRNRVSHGYDSIEMQTVWETVRHDIPALRAQLRLLLDQRGC